MLFSPTSISPLSSDSTIIMTQSPVFSPSITQSIPVVSSDYDDALLDSPVLSSVNLTYSKPIAGFYQNMNTDPELRDRMVKHFYLYKTLGDWIYDDLLDVLNYFKVDEKGDVHLIKSMDEYKETTVDADSDSDIEKKIKYMRNNVFKRKHMAKILKSFVERTKTNWYDLPKREKRIKKTINKFLKRRLRKMIKKND